VNFEPHHAACKTRSDDEVERITAWEAERDLAERRRDLLDRMGARNAARLERLREDEGRLL
jgi:hypothetical protein